MRGTEETELDEIRRRFEELKSQTRCFERFACLEHELRPRCKARNALMDGYVECLEPPPVACLHAQSFGDGCFCRCPVRVHLIKVFKV